MLKKTGLWYDLQVSKRKTVTINLDPESEDIDNYLEKLHHRVEYIGINYGKKINKVDHAVFTYKEKEIGEPIPFNDENWPSIIGFVEDFIQKNIKHFKSLAGTKKEGFTSKPDSLRELDDLIKGAAGKKLIDSDIKNGAIDFNFKEDEFGENPNINVTVFSDELYCTFITYRTADDGRGTVSNKKNIKFTNDEKGADELVKAVKQFLKEL